MSRDQSKWRDGKYTVQTGTDDNRDNDDFWCFMQTADWVMGDLFVNTDKVPAGSITAWKDLLDPKYKGKIIAHDPRRPGAGQATAAYLYSVFGEDFVRKLYVGPGCGARHQLLQEPRGGRDGAVRDRPRLRAGGGRAIPQEGPADRARVPQGRHGAQDRGFSGIAALNGPNPNARGVFVNWFITKRTQEKIQCLLLERSLRMDLDSYACIPEYTSPRDGVSYPVHDYDKGHHFGAKTKLRSRITAIFGK